MGRLATFFLAVLGIVAAACMMEVILQFVEANSYNSIINDPVSGLLIYRPNTTFVHSQSCYDNSVEVNSLGLHAPPVETEKPAGVFRIVVVGNSFVEAVQVPIAQMFTTILQDDLNAEGHRTYTYEVVPVGYSGNGTFLDILYYLRFGEKLKPDLVIDLTTEKEIEVDASGAAPAPQFDTQGNLVTRFPGTAQNTSLVTLTNLMRKSQLLVNLHNRYLILKQNIHDDLAHSTSPLRTGGDESATSTDDAASWALEGNILRAFFALVAHDSSRFLLASWVTSQAATSTAESFAPRLAAIAGEAHFPYTDLAPSISAQSTAEGKSPVWSCDIHWNADGNRYAAQALFQYLQAHPSLIGM